MGEVKKTGTIAFLNRHMKGFRQVVIIVSCVSFLQVLPNVCQPLVNQILVDNILTGLNPEWFVPLMVMALFLVVFETILMTVEAKTWKFKTMMSITSTSEMFWHMLRLPVNFFHGRYTGDLASRINYGSDIATSNDRVLWMIGDLIVIFVYLYFMIKYSLFLSLFAIFHIFFTLFIVKRTNKKQVEVNREMWDENGKLQGYTTACIGNIEAIKGANSEFSYFKEWSKYFSRSQNASVKCSGFNDDISAIPFFIEAISQVLILGIGAYYIIQGYLTIGMFMTFQSFMSASVSPLNHITGNIQQIANVSAQVGRMEEVFDSECDVPDEITSSQEIKYGKLHGLVELRNVTFGYDPDAAPLIKDFNLRLEPGRSVAFVGPSGCGKSTMSKLISGLYQPWSGEILYDGMPQKEINRDVFANSVAIVDQNIVLFDGTIAENVKIWDDSIEDFAMILACHDAQIHEEIAVREKNYGALLENGGSNFSGGQRQRLELASAFAKEPSIMIMDEGTSALDAVTEEKIMQSIRNMGVSLIVIAHRLSTIRDCDEIIVLDHGEIIERGNHDELMALKGFYSKLVECN